MESQITRHEFPETREIEKREPTPMDVIQIAVSQGADVDKLTKLFDLQMRWEANQAKKAFDAAMQEFKKDPPEIEKNKLVSFGQTNYKHATLDHVCDRVAEALSKHGISHRWRVSQEEGTIRVSCILTHSMGHSEETTLAAGPDTSGSKNAIQAIGSTVTYLERYTLLAATGLAAANMDDDGQAAGPKMEKLQEWLDAFAGEPSVEALSKDFKEAFKEATKLGATDAMKRLVAAKDKRKAELEHETPA